MRAVRQSQSPRPTGPAGAGRAPGHPGQPPPQCPSSLPRLHRRRFALMTYPSCSRAHVRWGVQWAVLCFPQRPSDVHCALTWLHVPPGDSHVWPAAAVRDSTAPEDLESRGSLLRAAPAQPIQTRASRLLRPLTCRRCCLGSRLPWSRVSLKPQLVRTSRVPVLPLTVSSVCCGVTRSQDRVACGPVWLCRLRGRGWAAPGAAFPGLSAGAPGRGGVSAPALQGWHFPHLPGRLMWVVGHAGNRAPRTRP